jgi:hypothetical protein
MREEVTSRSGERGRRRNGGAFVCALLAVLGSLLLASSASALTQRGHTFTGSFGIEASAGVPLKDPAGVAVNESTGDIFVVDSGNNRIVEFDAAHHFVKTWGWGVKNGAKEFQTCTSACLAGIGGHSKGQLHGADEIAIDQNTNSKEDPSAGDIYVETVSPYEETLENGKELAYEFYVIEKFGPEGELISKGGRIKGYKEPESSKEAFEEEEFHGFTVGANGKLDVFYEEEVLEYNDATPNKFLAKFASEIEEEATPRSGIAVDSTGKTFYLAHAAEEEVVGESEPVTIFGKVARLEETAGEPVGLQLFPALTTQNSTGIAVDYANNDALLDTGAGVDVFGPSSKGGDALERFGEGHIHSGRGIAATRGEQVFVADAGSNEVDVFGPESPGAPSIDAESLDKLTQNSAELKAQINADGAASTYAFRYDTAAVPTAGEACSGSCVEVPVPAGELAAAYGDTEVSQALAGLQPGTLYHWRVLAYNAGAPAGVESSEQSFRTELASSAVLPDGRRWEMVSPLQKNGAAIEAQTREGGLIESSANGERLTYVAIGAFPGAEGNRAPEPSQILAERGTKEWSDTDIDPKQVVGLGVAPGSRSALPYKYFTPGLTETLIDPFKKEQYEYAPLNEEVEPGQKPKHESTPYSRSLEAPCLTNPVSEKCFVPLLTPEALQGNVPAEVEVEGKKVPNEVGEGIKFVDATPDLKHIILQSNSRTAVLSSEPAGKESVYESNEGHNVLVSVLPNGAPAEAAALGLADSNFANAVSSDGSRVVFSSSKGGAPLHLYLRDVPRGETIQLDAPEAGGETEPVHAAPKFQDASTDDSQIFFTDEQRLTPDSTASSFKVQPDLYDCHIVENAQTGHLECKLSDLSVDSHAGETADVQGYIPGAGHTGETVYFVANGALASGASPGSCKPGQEPEREHRLLSTCSLYVDHFDAATETWEPPKFVATLSGEDEADWRDPQGQGQTRGQQTSSVTGDGNLIAFVSDRPLTGYDNRDVTSGEPDTEVFQYDAASEHITCVSCNPFGRRPQGVFDRETKSGEGRGLLVDRPLTWAGRWISGTVPGWTAIATTLAPYQSRYVFEDGRMFFTSAEALVPQDTNGKEDVYEYEPAGVGGCTTESETYSGVSDGCVSLISSGTSSRESAFLDASESGNDVFFLTAEKLVPSDTDTYYDVYDAGICGQAGAHACLETPAESKPPCEEEATCRGSSTETGPQFATPGSIAVNGSTNSSSIEVLSEKKAKPSSAELLTKELAKCRKLSSHAKRAACEKAATLRYGTKAEKLNVSLKACHADKKRKQRLACEAQARKKYGTAKKAAHGARSARARRGR